MHKNLVKTTFFLGLLFFLCSGQVCAQPEKEKTTLEMFYDEDDVVITPTRYPKSISRVAENVTIITAEQIQAINAHTVTDVLNTITGVQVVITGGPGSLSDVLIQGSAPNHVLVMIDGVSQNILSEAKADVGAMPVQNIERIEIVKGPASSAWGSSLGGVINIITKSPDDTRKLGGTVSASIGNRNTGDYRGEVSGKVGGLGYYLSGGGLVSDGLRPRNSLNGGNMYTKLQLAATRKADLTFSFGYNAGFRGVGEFPAADLSFDNDFAYLFSNLTLNYLLSNELSLDLSLHTARRDSKLFFNQLSTGIRLGNLTRTVNDTDFGGSAKLAWTQKLHQLLAGVDFDLGELESNSFTNGKQRLDKWALFANETLTFGGFSFIPGIRYDYTSSNGDFWSPSMGATYSLADNTILRTYVAGGFSVPPLGFTSGQSDFFRGNPNLKMETVWSYAAGFETAALRFVWLKTMFFRNDINDVVDDGILIVDDGNEEPTVFRTKINSGKQRRQGVEVEVKTMPVYNTSMLAGYTYLDAKDRATGNEIPGVAKYTIDAGIQYDDKKTFQGSLKGHYIRWQADPDDAGNFNAIVWDLNLAKKVVIGESRAASVFFTAHNIFNSSQFPVGLFRNPGRWFEGGVRFDF
jgi:vitamin B12 transporter